jgi:hypothetical protein
MSVKQSNQLTRNKGLVHIPSGEIYEFKPSEQLVLTTLYDTQQIMEYLDRLYPLTMTTGMDDFHKFLWECASSTDRCILISMSVITGEYIQDINPEFDITEFEII